MNMKVGNRDLVDISQLSRSKRGEATQAAKNKRESEGATGAGDLSGVANVELSSDAKALSTANQIARTDNLDQAKIDRIKALINGGNYKPDMGAVSEKMINETLLQDVL
jgi:flagellar biosynthesis anti-sigma factor FlgM